MASTARVSVGVAAGFITLMVVMGIGRFLYTPLLPIMMMEYGFSTEQAGLLASLNYVGYLAGAFIAGPLCHRFREFPVLVAGLVLSCLTTAATAFSGDFVGISAARLLAGTASGLAFVAVSGLVFHIISRDGRENLAGLYYGGVGGGIVITSLAAAPIAQLLGAGGTWLVFALVSAILAGTVVLMLRGCSEPHHAGHSAVKAALPWSPRFFRLVAAYGLEGFGYIITGTFMVAAAKAAVGPQGAQGAWILAGCAALPSAFLWSHAARRWGRLKPLVVACFVQACGIALPSVVPGITAVLSGALLFGGTFMGIVTLALSEGAACAPTARARVVGLMTGVYGIGQIAGPSVAGYFAARSGTYHTAAFIASAALMAAGAILIPDAIADSPNEKRREPCHT